MDAVVVVALAEVAPVADVHAAVGAAVFLSALAFILPSALDRSTDTGPASPERRFVLRIDGATGS